MAKTIVNLVSMIVNQEAEGILNTYPYHPYQHAFSSPDMRQRLISYVLSRTPGLYAVVEDENSQTLSHETSCCPTVQRHQIAALIHQGIRKLIEEKPQWAHHRVPEATQAKFAPSNWFG